MEKEHEVVLSKQYINKVKPRGGNVICNMPFLSDNEWKQAQELIHKRGPLSGVEALLYQQEHDRFAVAHFLNLVFELELAYTTIKALSHE